MSVFHHPSPLISGASLSCRQSNEHPKVCLSPPLSLSSPVVKKKAILISSFDEKGLIFEKGNTKLSAAGGPSDLISYKTSCQLMRGKECLYSQRNNKARASTLPRTKPSTHSSLPVSAKPNICISLAPQPNSSPTLPTFKPRPRDSLLLPASVFCDYYPVPHQPDPKPRVSPTLTVPTPRRSPSPSIAPNSQEERQPSPVAQERHARSISISNRKVENCNKVKNEVLDQGTLLDFTHPGQRRVCREPRHQTESYRLPAVCHSSYIAHSKVGLKKTEITATDRPKTLSRNPNIVTVPKLKPITKQEKSREPREVTRSSNVVSAVFDAPSMRSRLQSRLADYSPRSNFSHTSCTSFDQPFEQTETKMLTKLLPSTDSQMSLNSGKNKTRRPFDFDNETTGKPEVASLNSKSPQNPRPVPNQSPNQSTKTDVQSAVSQSEHASEDFSCQSRDISQTPQTSRSPHRLNQVKKRMAVCQSLGTSQPDEPLYSQYGSFSDTDLQPEDPWNQELNKQSDNHKVLNQTGVFETPDHKEVPTKLLEHPWARSMAGCSFNTNKSGNSSKKVSDWSQQIFYQPSEETTRQGCQQKHQPNYSVPDRAFITEDSEDPNYVTMYYPDSIYVGEYRHIQNPTMTLTDQSQSID
ncbi:hypothetical protein AMECASPLE_006870 [Ameca splendens]|uniref:Uncharacterized protein n=1 Tax=Ameca splendens TaxID=208324 RepID=A0ABV0YLY2_9TELE